MSQVPISLETPRLVLRAFQDSHIGAFLGYRCDSKVAKFQSWDAPYPKVEAIAFIKLMKQLIPGVLGEWYQLAIVLKAIGEMIDDCTFYILVDDGRQAKMGFTLARSPL